MLKYENTLIYLFVAFVIAPFWASAANTWRLEENQNWDLVATDSQKKFLTAISDAQKIADEGKTKAAGKAFAAVKKNFSEFSGKDLNLFIKAEKLFSQHKFTKSARQYDKLLTKYQDSILRNMAINREYEIGMTFLDGRKKTILGMIRIAGNSEGISILEKMTDHAGFDSQIAIKASIAIAKNYEKREKFNEAYLKWYEIYSLGKKDSVINRDALLGMAQAKHAIYNKNPESKKSFYDASSLRSARSYYEMFRTNYPDYAEKEGVGKIIEEITEQLAYKELSIGLYYQKMNNKQSANLYFDMVITTWPQSKSAEIAKDMLKKNTGS